MTDDITLEDLGLPPVLYDPETDAEWRLNEPDVSVAVVVAHEPDEDGGRTEHAGSYPLETLRSKLDHGDLTAEPPEPDEPEEPDEEHVCEECGDVFPTAQALGGHMAAHTAVDD